jgi:hypothetical protein
MWFENNQLINGRTPVPKKGRDSTRYTKKSPIFMMGLLESSTGVAGAAISNEY